MAQNNLRRLQYEDWVRCHAPELYRFAYRMTGRREIAEDLVQETFVEAWKNLDKQREPGRGRAWLFQILRFRYAHYIRDTQHLRLVKSDNDLDQRSADPGIPMIETLANQELLQNAMAQLTPQLRETFLMVFLQGCTCRETAEALHIPLGTVLSRLDRARHVLRDNLKIAAPRQLHLGEH